MPALSPSPDGSAATRTVRVGLVRYSASVTDQTTLDTRRGQLHEERDRLTTQIASLDVGSDQSPAYDDNFADSGQVAAEQGEAQALLNQFNEQIDEIDHALAKFDAGTYGLCEVCQKPIAPARLEAMPATRFCIDHA